MTNRWPLLLGLPVALGAFAAAVPTAEGSARGPAPAAVADAACAGLDPSVQDTSLHGMHVVSVGAVRTRTGKALVDRPRGAVVRVAAEPGMSAAYLERVVSCQAAKYAAAQRPDDGRDPLAVRGATVNVSESGRTFTVRIVASRPDAASEIHRRAQALVASR